MGDLLQAKPAPDVTLGPPGGLPVQADPHWSEEARRKAELAQDLTLVSGTADEHDAKLVEAELAKMPIEALEILKKDGVRVVVCRNDVLEVLPELAKEQPDGWDPGDTWTGVPGLYTVDDFGNKMVIIATTGHGTPDGAHVPTAAKDGSHGSANLVIHESFHAVDLAGGAPRSLGDDFLAARAMDAGALPKYERTKSEGGVDDPSFERAAREAYAESAARYYGGDPRDAADHPMLHAHWDSNPLAPKP